MSDREKSSRREFIRRAGGLVAAGAGGVYLAGHSRPAAARVIGANERINVAIIGCGWRGGQHMRILMSRAKEKGDCQIVAVCDLYERRLREAVERTGAKGYRDYREVLARNDVDAVFLPVPWHWHAKLSIDACKAGKDVYVETPMTISVESAREVYETVKRTKRVLQVGNQMASWDQYWRAREVVRSGVLGKIVVMMSSWCRNSREGQWNYTGSHPCAIREDATPKTVDWDTWLGWRWKLAPKRPFDRERFFRWRKFRDYGGGSASDLLCHSLGAMLIATGREFPYHVSSSGGQYVEFDRDVYDTYITTIEYPSRYTAILDSTMVNEYGWPEVIRGHEATLLIDRGGVTVAPERPFARGFRDKCEKAGLKGEWIDIELPRWGGVRKTKALRIEKQPRPDHWDNFFHCIRTRQRPVEDALAGYMITVAIELGVRSYYENRTMYFDPEKQHVLDKVPPRTNQRNEPLRV